MYALDEPRSERDRTDRDHYRRGVVDLLASGGEVPAPPMASPFIRDWLAGVLGAATMERPVRIEYDERTGNHVALIEGVGE